MSKTWLLPLGWLAGDSSYQVSHSVGTHDGTCSALEGGAVLGLESNSEGPALVTRRALASDRAWPAGARHP